MNLITSAPAIHIYAREPHTRRKDDEARRTSDAVSVVMELRESPTYYPSDARLSQMSRLCIGWSTIAAKNATCQSWDPLCQNDENKSYCTLSDEEQEVIHKVVMEAEAEDMDDLVRKQEYAKKYHQLVSKCSGNGDSSCILCGVRFKGRGIPQKSVNCHDCTKKICARCRCSYTLKNCSEVTLCRMCFSYRELWKITGAWFTHDIEPYMDHAGCYHIHTKPWSENVMAPNKLKEEHESQVHSSLHTDSLSSAMSKAEFSADSSPAIKDACSTDVSGLPICKIEEFSPALACCQDFQCPQDSFITSPEASSQMVSRLRGKTRKNIVHQDAIDVCDEDGASDKKQSTNVYFDDSARIERSISLTVASKHSEANDIDGRDNALSVQSEDKKSRKERHSFVKSLSLRPLGSKQGRMKNSCGSIDFTMEYSRETAELRVHIILCQNLLPADANGSSDPYVVLYLSPGGKHTKRSTRVVSENLNPVFNEDITYHSISTSVVHHSELVLVVFDYDVISRDDFLGATSIPLRRALHGDVMTFSLSLKNQYPAFIYVNGAGNNGQVLVSMSYSTSSKALCIHVVKAARLSPTHSSTSANPYVKVFLLKDRRVELKMKTSVCMGSLSPDFNEEMSIPIDLQVLSKRRIRIAVWHHRKTGHNVNMGTAILDPSAPGILSAVLSSPDKTIREWIVLSG